MTDRLKNLPDRKDRVELAKDLEDVESDMSHMVQTPAMQREINQTLYAIEQVEEVSAKANAPAPAALVSPAAAQQYVAPSPSIPGGKWPRPLASQGFEGPNVQHIDMKSATSDWQMEFGPSAGHRSVGEICKHRPNNEWCRLHMLRRSARMQTTTKYYWWDLPGWFPYSDSGSKSATYRNSAWQVLALAPVMAFFVEGTYF